MFKSENSEIVANAIKFVKTNSGSSEISVETVAEQAGFTPNYFNKVFTMHTGFSIMKYVRFERLRRAALMLRNSDRDIIDIALECGYESHEGFIRSFKQQYEITPSEYRDKITGKAVYWGELADATLAGRFIFDNPTFEAIDEAELIDILLEKDAKRFGYLCTEIKYMGLKAVKESDKGFVLIGGQPDGEYYLILVSDDKETVEDWMGRLSNIDEIVTSAEISLPDGAQICREYMYFGEGKSYPLPEGVEVHRLTVSDIESIKQWTKGRSDGYASHLNDIEKWQSDESVLEYGIFANGRMIGAAGCGIDSVHGFAINNGIVLYLPDDVDTDMCRAVFSYITFDTAEMGVIPFIDFISGKESPKNGGVFIEEMGYTLVNTVISL